MRYKDVPNGLGGAVSELEPYKRVYAELRPLRGKEYQEYNKDTNRLEYKITIRYLPGLLPSDVVSYQGRQFLINAAINLEERNAIHELMCTEQLQDKKPEVKLDGS